MNIYFAERFPMGHPRAGEPTHFADKILSGEKVHTIRNPKNIAQLEKTLQKCEVKLISGSWRVIKVLSNNIRTQRIIKVKNTFFEHCQNDFFEIQNILCEENGNHSAFYDIETEILANYDGLNKQDFLDWFSKIEYNKEMLLINFDNYYHNGFRIK